jgi:hypothetical protein
LPALSWLAGSCAAVSIPSDISALRSQSPIGYRDRVDFLYLHVAKPQNQEAKRGLGFTSTPHFFFLRADGSTVDMMQGVVPGDSVRQALERLLAGR